MKKYVRVLVVGIIFFAIEIFSLRLRQNSQLTTTETLVMAFLFAVVCTLTFIIGR